MSKKLLIDMIKLRELGDRNIEAIDKPLFDGNGFKTLREIATFKYTCRRCADAPCIAVCPVDALQKDENGMIHRSINLCIRCKSCIAICPFGTLTLDLFQPKTVGCTYYDISKEDEMERFAEAFPDEVVSITEQEADNEANIYMLSDRVLIKDFVWDKTQEP